MVIATGVERTVNSNRMGRPSPPGVNRAAPAGRWTAGGGIKGGQTIERPMAHWQTEQHAASLSEADAEGPT